MKMYVVRVLRGLRWVWPKQTHETKSLDMHVEELQAC